MHRLPVVSADGGRPGSCSREPGSSLGRDGAAEYHAGHVGLLDRCPCSGISLGSSRSVARLALSARTGGPAAIGGRTGRSACHQRPRPIQPLVANTKPGSSTLSVRVVSRPRVPREAKSFCNFRLSSLSGLTDGGCGFDTHSWFSSSGIHNQTSPTRRDRHVD